MLNKISILLATFFYVGKIPKAPGTWGTLATIPLWYLLAQLNPLWYMTGTFMVVLLGIFVAQVYEKNAGHHDSKEIVIDEVAGFLIAMTWLPMTWQSVVAGFLLFRFFDIVKPPPIRQIDQRMQGGIGVMADDVAAGLIVNILLQLVYTKTGWLGSQIIQM